MNLRREKDHVDLDAWRDDIASNHEERKTQALEGIVERLSTPPSKTSSDEMLRFELSRLLLRLSRDAERKIRRRLAERIGRETFPLNADILAEILSDDADVADALLNAAKSGRFADKHLAEAIRRRPVCARRVASRHDLGNEAVAAAARRGDARARRLLLENHRVAIDEKDLALLMKEEGRDDAVVNATARRPDLPHRLRARLACDVADRMIRTTAKRDPERRRAERGFIRRAERSGIVQILAQTPDDALNDVADELEKRDRIDEELLLLAACRGALNAMRVLLARRLNENDPKRVGALLASSHVAVARARFESAFLSDGLLTSLRLAVLAEKRLNRKDASPGEFGRAMLEIACEDDPLRDARDVASAISAIEACGAPSAQTLAEAIAPQAIRALADERGRKDRKTETTDVVATE